MNENRNDTAKWLQYLLYAGIAATVNLILNLFLPGSLFAWVGYILSAANLYLFFRLKDANPRYKTTAIFYAVPLAISVLGIQMLGLVGDICGIVAQYQEFHAHGELVEERDPKLSDKWSTLFGMQVAVSVIVVLLGSLAAGVMAAAEMGEAVITAAVAVVGAVLVLIMKALYLSYLKRTIKALETEFLVEGVKE